MKNVLLLLSVLIIGGVMYYIGIFNNLNNTEKPVNKKEIKTSINGFVCNLSNSEFKKSSGIEMNQETKNKYLINIKNINEMEDNYEKYFNLGMQYRNLDDLETACSMFLKSIKYDEHYLTYSALGTIYQEREDFTQAEKAWLKALEKNSQDVNTYKKLGSLYFSVFKKAPHEMYEYYGDAILKTDGNIELSKHYAEYLEEINDLENAIIIWNGIAEKEGESNYIKEKIEVIQEKMKN